MIFGVDSLTSWLDFYILFIPQVRLFCTYLAETKVITRRPILLWIAVPIGLVSWLGSMVCTFFYMDDLIRATEINLILREINPDIYRD